MKLALPKIKISIRTITSLILAVVILFEIYMAYFSIFSKLAPQPVVTVNTSIVRINRASLNEITLFLDGLANFQPTNLILTNPNPFRYSQ